MNIVISDKFIITEEQAEALKSVATKIETEQIGRKKGRKRDFSICEGTIGGTAENGTMTVNYAPLKEVAAAPEPPAPVAPEPEKETITQEKTPAARKRGRK